MRKYVYVIMALFFSACYEDKGNYDYEIMEECKVTIPSGNRNVLFWQTLNITPTVETSIDKADLAYQWEFFDITNSRNQFVPVYEGEVMNFVCAKDDSLLINDNAYPLRLCVTQLSTGRKFYSNEILINLMAQPRKMGAMVLHGDGTSSDIGIVVAKEFYHKDRLDDLEEEVLPHYYSEANGEKMSGKGKWLMTSFMLNADRYQYADNIVTVATTDQGTMVAEGGSMEKKGDWNILFRGGYNKGEPLAACVKAQTVLFLFDGGDIFMRDHATYTVAQPALIAEDYPDYKFAPQILHMSGVKYVLFDQNTRSFMRFDASAGMMIKYSYKFTNLPFNFTGNLPFNPSNMQADLVFMAPGGEGDNAVAVMKEDNGNYFLAEMNPKASKDNDIPLHKYSLSHIADVQNEKVIAWDFGAGFVNMGYYATADGVYQFAVTNGNTINPVALRMSNGDEVRFKGRITMMEVMQVQKQSSDYLQANKLLMVGTYEGTSGSGRLYSLELDQMTGLVSTMKIYEGFDEIYDAHIKEY